MNLKSSLSYLFLSLLVALMLALSSPVFAISPSSILVDVAPPNPAPYKNVTVTLSSYAANLDSVSISWFVDGKNVLSGIGQKSFSITAGASGSTTQITAKVFIPEGEIDKTIVITPSVMVLLWEATDSYVPPFYKGKALIPAESTVKIVAMPEIKTGNGGMANSKNMTYSWKKDYTNMPNESGYGKNFFTFINDYLDDSNNISVVATTLDQNYSGEADINVGITAPEISFYKKDNELGILWEKILPNDYQIEGDTIVVASPYFITPRNIRRPELIFNWSINYTTINVPKYRKNILPLRVEEGTSGISALRLDIENTDKIFETAHKEINVQF